MTNEVISAMLAVVAGGLSQATNAKATSIIAVVACAASYPVVIGALIDIMLGSRSPVRVAAGGTPGRAQPGTLLGQGSHRASFVTSGKNSGIVRGDDPWPGLRCFQLD